METRTRPRPKGDSPPKMRDGPPNRREDRSPNDRTIREDPGGKRIGTAFGPALPHYTETPSEAQQRKAALARDTVMTMCGGWKHCRLCWQFAPVGACITINANGPPPYGRSGDI